MKKLALLLPLAFVSCVYWTPRSRTVSADAKVIPNVPMQVWDIKSCGAGSLSSVLQHHGDTTTMQEWDAKLPQTRGGTMSIDLVLAARSKGFDSKVITGDRASIEQEVRDGRPVILMLQVIAAPGRSYDFFHYVVIDGIDDQNHLLRTQFGDGKARWVKFEKLEQAWIPAGRAAIVIRPKDPAAEILRAAVQLEEKGDYVKAADVYRDLLLHHPSHVIAWTNLGNAESHLGNRDAAERAFRKALELDGNARDAMNNLAWLLYESKRYDEAESFARKAVSTPGPDSYLVLDTLARILAAKGSCDEASQRFREAMAAVPRSRTAERSEIEAASKSACGHSGVS